MKKLSIVFLVALMQHIPAHAEGFFTEVAKGVAVNILTDVIRSAIATPVQGQSNASPQVPRTVEGSVADTRRVEAIIAALTDPATPLEERIGLYATKVDYFAAGVVDHAFILKDRRYFENRWPARSYKIISVDEIAVDPGGKFAAARYTVQYVVKRPGDEKSGTSKVMVLLGSFDAQPRVYAIKEWVRRN